MKVLGFSAFFHDSAAALIVGNTVVAAAEEERFSREKHTRRFPGNAIRACLQAANVAPDELDAIAYFLDASPHRAYALGQVIHNAARWLGAHPFALRNGLRWLRNQPRSQSRLRRVAEDNLSLVRWAAIVQRELGLNGRRPAFVGVPHHLAHVASSYYLSGFDEAAVLVADGRGEWTTTTLAAGRGHDLQTLAHLGLPHSLGFFYGAMTEFLGFRAQSEEGKVMGLAAYGRPHYADAFSRFLEITPAGLFRLDTGYIDYATAIRTGYFPPALAELLGTPRAPGAGLEDRHADIASSLQARFEAALLALAGRLQRESGLARLCLAGGTTMNSAANGRIARDMGWQAVYAPPAPGDAGTALGAAAWVAARSGSGRLEPAGAYLGPAYDEASCRRELEAAGLPYIRHADVADLAATLLAEGKVIGWFQGRMEFGPRALGNRSILADPRQAATRDRVNRLKGRELWRPLAPAVLAEKAGAWFVEPGASPYMSFVKSVRPEKKEQIAACVHVDGTARVQTVTYADNPRFWRLLHAFERRTGVPCLLNTSFNGRGEPIVCSPADAIRAFMALRLDYLILGDLIVARPALVLADSEGTPMTHGAIYDETTA